MYEYSLLHQFRNFCNNIYNSSNILIKMKRRKKIKVGERERERERGAYN